MGFTDQKYSHFFPGTASKVNVTPEIGMRLAVVFACINALAQDLASLPKDVKRPVSDGIENVPSDPVHNLISKRPNSDMTAYHFWYTLICHALSWGSGYAFIDRDGNGRPKELILLAAWDMHVKQVEGEWFYIFRGTPIPARDIYHLRFYTKNGVQGISHIRQHAESIGLAVKQRDYSAKTIGSRPPGYLHTEQILSDTVKQANKEAWKAQADDQGTAFLTGGIKYDSIMIPPEDAQIIPAIANTKKDILSIFRMPPNIIQDYGESNYNNSEEQTLVYAKYTLTPLIVCAEQEANYKLFPEGSNKYVKFNINGLLRGDIKAQTEFLRFMTGMGHMNSDEVRELYDMKDQVDDLGKDYYVQLGFAPKRLMDDIIKNQNNNAPPSEPAQNSRSNGLEKILENGQN